MTYLNRLGRMRLLFAFTLGENTFSGFCTLVSKLCPDFLRFIPVDRNRPQFDFTTLTQADTDEV